MKKNAIKTFSTVFVITLLAKIIGLLRDIVFAQFYGTGYVATAFFASLRIPTQLMDIGLSAAITSTFIPVFNEIVEKDGKESANKFANNFINIIALISTVISVIGILFAPQVVQLLAGGFDQKTFELTTQLIRITFSMIIFASVAFSFVGFLQSYGEFNIPAMTSGLSNLVVIVYLLLFREKFGIQGVAVFMLIAWSLQVFIQIPSAIKKGYKPRLKVDFRDSNIKKVFTIAIPIIISTSVLPINTLVSTRLASGMGESAVSALEYAYKLYIVAVGIFTYAIGNMIFPELARLIANNEKEAYIKIINKGIKIMLCLLIPLSVGIAIYRTDLIQILYQRGAFNAYSTSITSEVLLFYAIGIIGFGVVEIMNKSFYARQDTKTPLIVGIIIVIVNVILSVVLSKMMGLNGLALSTSITSILNAIILSICANRANNGILSKELGITIVKIVVSAWAMGITVAITNIFLSSILIGGTVIDGLRMLIGVGIGVGTYYWFTLLLGIEESSEFLTYIVNIVKGKKETI